MSFLWHTFLYNPLLNGLIALYNGPARQNLGVAIIELTVIIRILILPLTVVAIRARSRYELMQPELERIEDSYRNDSINRKMAIRTLLARHHIRPWAKAFIFGLQFIVLVVLYSVFVEAVRGGNFAGLYSWNQAPDFLNPMFFGSNLSAHSIVWAGVIGALLYFDIWLEQRKHGGPRSNGEVWYRIFFPILFTLVLYALPAGKSVFVLSSFVFSLLIDGIVRLFGGKHVSSN